MQSDLLKRVNTQNLQGSAEASGQFEFFVQDRHHQVGRHRDPDLRFHRIRTRAEIMLDPHVALDPLEKQFDVPALFVKHRQRQCRQFHVVGQEHQITQLLHVEVADSPQRKRKVLSSFWQRQFANVVAANSGCFFHGSRLFSGKPEVVLGAGAEKRARCGDVRSMEFKSLTPVFPPLSMKNNMIEKNKALLSGHQCRSVLKIWSRVPWIRRRWW